MQKIVVYDIDNTLYDGTLGTDLLKELMVMQVFPEEIGKQIIEDVTSYKKNEISREELFERVYPVYALGLKGVAANLLQETAQKVWESVKSNLYTHARELTATLSQKGYISIALSGSSEEMIKCISDELGFNFFAGAKCETIEGKFTGNFLGAPSKPEIKEKYLREIIANNHIEVDWKNSFAFGDSESERNLLNLVGYPVVVSPHEAFAREAQESQWNVTSHLQLMDTVNNLLNSNLN